MAVGGEMVHVAQVFDCRYRSYLCHFWRPSNCGTKGNPMKATLKPGLTRELKFRVPDTKTVPKLHPESPEFQAHAQSVCHRFYGGHHQVSLKRL